MELNEIESTFIVSKSPEIIDEGDGSTSITCEFVTKEDPAHEYNIKFKNADVLQEGVLDLLKIVHIDGTSNLGVTISDESMESVILVASGFEANLVPIPRAA